MMRLSGLDKHGKLKTISWHLTAKQGHGPRIPAIPAIILVKKLIKNELTIQGAMPSMGLFTLEEFTDEVRDLDIQLESD